MHTARLAPSRVRPTGSDYRCRTPFPIIDKKRRFIEVSAPLGCDCPKWKDHNSWVCPTARFWRLPGLNHFDCSRFMLGDRWRISVDTELHPYPMPVCTDNVTGIRRLYELRGARFHATTPGRAVARATTIMNEWSTSRSVS